MIANKKVSYLSITLRCEWFRARKRWQSAERNGFSFVEIQSDQNDRSSRGSTQKCLRTSGRPVLVSHRHKTSARQTSLGMPFCLRHGRQVVKQVINNANKRLCPKCWQQLQITTFFFFFSLNNLLLGPCENKSSNRRISFGSYRVFRFDGSGRDEFLNRSRNSTNPQGRLHKPMHAWIRQTPSRRRVLSGYQLLRKEL